MRKIGGAAKRRVDRPVDDLERHFRRLARGDVRRFYNEFSLVGGYALGEAGRDVAHDRGLITRALRMRCKSLVPGEAHQTRPLAGFAPCGRNISWNLERRIGPAKLCSRGLDFGRTERRAMRRLGSLLVGRAITDHGAAGDEGRTGLSVRLGKCGLNRRWIVAVDCDRMPAGGGEAGALVHAGRKLGRAVDGDAVVVPHHDQTRQLQMAGEIDRFMADAFHQAAVARDDVGIMINEVAVAGSKCAFGDRHADGSGETLSERAGRRLDAERMPVFRVAGGLRPELTEALQLVERHVWIAGQMEKGVEQHRAVARRQHETVAVRPVGRGGIEFEKLREQHRRDVRHAHRHPGMAGLGLFDRVYSEKADGVGHGLVRDRSVLNPDIHVKRPLVGSGAIGAAAPFSQLQDHRRENQLHCDVELAARDHDGVRAAHEASVNHRQEYGKSMPCGSRKRMTTIDSSGVGIQRAMKGFDVSTVGTRWKLMSVWANCGQM